MTTTNIIERERLERENGRQLRLEPQAFHGLAGDVVRSVDPFAESDNAALLLNTLTAYGNIIGSSSYATVNHDEHPPRLNVVQVGQTAKGRKGSGLSSIRYLFSIIDGEWSKKRVKIGGLSSGEGLIYNVRDPQYKERGDEVGWLIRAWTTSG